MIFNKMFLSIFKTLYNHAVNYPTPATITYAWGFGSLAGIIMGFQLISGVFLAFHYVAHSDLSFNFVEHIMREVNYGWLFRYLHLNGASFYFLAVYLHIARGLYYKSYLSPRRDAWLLGMVIYILMMATAFIGYVLPWGQMSFWGATVITNILAVIPVIGPHFVEWLWGGFSVGNPTLTRFYSLHYLCGCLLIVLIIVHIALVHDHGSSDEGPASANIFVRFKTFFTSKDLFGLLVFSLFAILMIFFYPNFLGHPDNYIPANSMVTPAHIVPEWYFLPFYAILRSFPNKLLGVALMGLSLVLILILPFGKEIRYIFNHIEQKFVLPIILLIVSKFNFINQFYVNIRNNLYIENTEITDNSIENNKVISGIIKFILSLFSHGFLFSIFLCSFIGLLIIGGRPAEEPYSIIGAYLSYIYFICLFIMLCGPRILIYLGFLLILLFVLGII